VRATVKQFANLLRALPETLKVARDSVGDPRTLVGRIRDSVHLAPRTPFNAQVGPGRSFATASIPLAEVKHVARTTGTSLNDVVMTLCAGALRTYLLAAGELPKESLIAAMPISLRVAGDAQANNQVSMAQCTLATDIADPLERLRTIAAATGRIKDAVSTFRHLIPTDFPGLAAPLWASGLSRLWARGKIAERLPPLANLVISNVPGPPVDLYLAGARLKHYFPVSIVIHGLALNITLQSYAGHLEFGVIASSDVVPRPAAIANGFARELSSLLRSIR
jgi:WS/DGAT/MGAT family acyltransferase